MPGDEIRRVVQGESIEIEADSIDPETREPYPVCSECGKRHPISSKDEEDGWYFYEIVGSDRATEDKIWEAARLLKRDNKGTKPMASVMVEEARKAKASGNIGEAYLWALIVGKVFGLFGA